jgi:4'-phosphopantetheinyl transferase
MVLEVFAVKVDLALSIEKMQNLLEYVDSDKQKRIEAFHRKEDKVRCLVGDILVRYILAEKLNISPSHLKFFRNAYGKPFLKDENLFFNLSHSGCWVAAVFDNEENGIDVQEIGEADLFIAEKFFRRNEYRELLKVAEYDRADIFYKWWSLKECYIKTTGRGLSQPLDSFIVKNWENGLYHSYVEGNEMFFKMYDLDSGYKMAVSNSKGCFESLKILSLQDLYQSFMEAVKPRRDLS